MTASFASDATEEPPSSPVPEAVMAFERAFTRRNWPELRRLCHDEARLESLASGRVLGPDETIEAMRSAALGGLYVMSRWRTEPLDPEAVLIFAHMRHQHPGSGFRITDSNYVWVMTCRDGLVWRVKVCSDRDTALRLFAEHGRSLGM
jgi:hypothetical protein